MVKTKLKYVIPTFFTCFVQILIARTERNSCWAGATHDSLWPRNRVPKWGRSSPTRCFARVQIDRRAMRNLLLFGHLFDRQVTARVTHMVIFVFHAHFTFPRCK